MIRTVLSRFCRAVVHFHVVNYSRCFLGTNSGLRLCGAFSKFHLLLLMLMMIEAAASVAVLAVKLAVFSKRSICLRKLRKKRHWKKMNPLVPKSNRCSGLRWQRWRCSVVGWLVGSEFSPALLAFHSCSHSSSSRFSLHLPK